jgi:hypothetical protein
MNTLTKVIIAIAFVLGALALLVIGVGFSAGLRGKGEPSATPAASSSPRP